MDDEEIPLALALDDAPEAKRAEDEAQPERTTVPVTIVTGFLGSGKTTLVRHILTADHGYRIAVILNEFGEDVGIEASFVQSQEGLQRQHDGEWVELTNGCMCCAVKSDFLQALESLLDRPAGQSRRFDYILIETTGLANPGPIATALWTDAELESRVALDGVVTVVDAVNIDRQLHEPRPRGVINEAQVQVAYADIVVLNKLDLAEEEALVRAEADIRAINSGVTIVRTQRSVVDLGLILNRNGYSHKGDLVLPPIAEADDEVETGDAPSGALERSSHAGEATGRRRSTGVSCCSSRAHSFHARSSAASTIAAAAAAAVAACNAAAAAVAAGSSGPCSSADMSPAGSLVPPPSPLLAAAAAAPLTPTRGSAQAMASCADADHVHDNQVSTVSLRCDHPVDLERFKSWVDHLLWDRDSRADEIYRMKGLICVEGSDKKHMLQAVYELYEVVSGPEWQPGEARATRLVIIGRNLRPAAVKASWAEFVGVGQQQQQEEGGAAPA
ncbi:hypothetical protein PLESTB_000820300 [Pleodorina starrii]|uniref:CobW C-terminal domain-containing protein n=1 Tax=Pleodorina starrii TaxID=330485 RepID=A0A9W6BKR9_9CHLO|nr:hypothetical protein PLESTM_000135800 [Pleodorina starrii]GLC54071.1 hypothetical protein PLESTB_000820300 [Pleodorina starrii]GLC64623.1 hypothetical protein PLESTF_000186000 [Pleodorina starrii]